MRRPTFITTVLAASLALSGSALLWHPAGVSAADKDTDTRKERMEKNKWTNADRARDALDHLKKAQTQLENITNNNKDAGAAGNALKDTEKAIAQVDAYIAAVDEKKK